MTTKENLELAKRMSGDPHLLSLCEELVATHDENEWGEKTGSFPVDSEHYDPSMVGEFGGVIDQMRIAIAKVKLASKGTRK